MYGQVYDTFRRSHAAMVRFFDKRIVYGWYYGGPPPTYMFGPSVWDETMHELVCAESRSFKVTKS